MVTEETLKTHEMELESRIRNLVWTVSGDSCNPETLARDLRYLTKHGYKAEEAWGYDMFAWSEHVETVCLLTQKKA